MCDTDCQKCLPVSGLVSKCVLDFEICLHSVRSLEASVGVSELLRGNSVPFTCDNSRSGVKGETHTNALRLTGLHHGMTTCKRIRKNVFL